MPSSRGAVVLLQLLLLLLLLLLHTTGAIQSESESSRAKNLSGIVVCLVWSSRLGCGSASRGEFVGPAACGRH